MSKTKAQRDFDLFTASARTIHSQRVSNAKKYQGKWVAAFEGKIIATASTSTALVKELRSAGVDLHCTAMRYVDSSRQLVTYHC
ncbi:MAG: hypothetical protein JSS65_01910 [Armatimonadetes bacterium]|nr:hypothetical protein [Armatimonadota bacterium]